MESILARLNFASPLWPDEAYLIVAMTMFGTGLIFLWHDRERFATRALSLCMMAIAARLMLSGPEVAGLSDVHAAFPRLSILLEGIAIFAGIEWGRQVALTGTYPPGSLTLRLFRLAQILVVIYSCLRLGFDVLEPASARKQLEGVSRVTTLQWLLFAPLLTLAIGITGVAIARLRAVKIDDAELVRLQSLSLAGPFLLLALVLHADYVPATLTIGLLVFLWGSVRYLILQGRRGQFMRQFLSPQVAHLVQQEGMDRTLQRERRILTVVSCDLRGFTRFARQRDSREVTDLLERYYEVVGDVAAAHGGTVKDHAGDGVLILVGAPLPEPQHERRAVALALALRDEAQKVLQQAAPDLGIGVGLATGNTTVGAIRGAGRLEYVAVGNPVNLAARLCDRAADGEVLSDQRTADALVADDAVHVEERPPEPLKGFPEPIPVCALGGSGNPQWQRRGAQSRHRRRSRRRREHKRSS